MVTCMHDTTTHRQDNLLKHLVHVDSKRHLSISTTASRLMHEAGETPNTSCWDALCLLQSTLPLSMSVLGVLLLLAATVLGLLLCSGSLLTWSTIEQHNVVAAWLLLNCEGR